MIADPNTHDDHESGREDAAGWFTDPTFTPRGRRQDGDLSRSDEMLDVVGRFEAALKAHDLDTAMSAVSDDLVFESTSPAPDGARHEGHDALRAVLGEIVATTPAARFSPEEQFCDGIDRAMVRWAL